MCVRGYGVGYRRWSKQMGRVRVRYGGQSQCARASMSGLQLVRATFFEKHEKKGGKCKCIYYVYVYLFI